MRGCLSSHIVELCPLPSLAVFTTQLLLGMYPVAYLLINYSGLGRVSGSIPLILNSRRRKLVVKVEKNSRDTECLPVDKFRIR